MKAVAFALWAGATVATATVTGSSVMAGEHWKFNVVNKSNVAAVGFRTQENGEWSANWISDKIEPGDTFNMDFETNNGNCVVRTQIRFADGGTFDAPVDYCKINNLYIRDGNVTWD